MLVSVVIPTCDRPSMLARAIESVAAQTYKKVEVIVVDDASADDATRRTVDRFNDHRVRYLRNERPMGAPIARNRGIIHTNGDIVAFLDDDDEWMPTKIEKQIRVFEDDSSVGLTYVGVLLRYPALRLEYRTWPSLRGNVFRSLLMENAIGVTSAVAVRREVLESCGMFDPTFPARQDYDLWLRVAKERAVDFVREPLAISNQAVDIKRISSSVAPYKKAIELLDAKYADDIALLSRSERRKRRAAQHSFLAAQSMKAGDISQCRRYLIRSMLRVPAPKTALTLLASMGGIRYLVRLRQMSDRVRGIAPHG